MMFDKVMLEDARGLQKKPSKILFLVPLQAKKNLNFMAPFYGWGSTASRLEPLRGGSLLFTTKSPEIYGTYLINLGRMNG